MRMMLFFDLPTVTSNDLKAYRKFVKEIKKQGFYMLQESVYVKMAINNQVVESTISYLKSIIPSSGNIMVLSITEKQFSNIELLLGNSKSDVVNNVDRLIEL